MIFPPALLATVLATGILIGCAGIGGVLLVPALHFFGDLALHQAVSVSMASFMATGLVGTFIYARRGNLLWHWAMPLCMGAVPGAYLGAWLLNLISDDMLSILIGAFVLLSGIYALNGRPKVSTTEARSSSPVALMVIGLACGAGSALTGTGGPLLLMPILIFKKVPLLAAVSLAQVIQIPIATTATIGNLMHGHIDFKAVLVLAILLGIGTYLGAIAAHKLPVRFIEKTVATVLVATGLALVCRALFAG